MHPAGRWSARDLATQPRGQSETQRSGWHSWRGTRWGVATHADGGAAAGTVRPVPRRPHHADMGGREHASASAQWGAHDPRTPPRAALVARIVASQLKELE